MAIEKVTDHNADGIALLLEAWKNNNRDSFVALLSSYLTQVQEAEDALWDAVSQQGLDEVFAGEGAAAGSFLDALGAIVGELREGKSDADYLLYIKAKIKANNSDGHVEQLYEILRLIFTDISDHAAIRVRNLGNLELTIELASLTVAEMDAVARFMLLAIDAAARLVVILEATVFDPFTTSGTYAVLETSATQGFGSVYDGVVGGQLTHGREII